MEREIEDIDAGGTAYLYGHSSGAVLALEAVLRLGSKVQKVIMYDASYLHDEKEKAEYTNNLAKQYTNFSITAKCRSNEHFFEGYLDAKSICFVVAATS